MLFAYLITAYNMATSTSRSFSFFFDSRSLRANHHRTLAQCVHSSNGLSLSAWLLSFSPPPPPPHAPSSLRWQDQIGTGQFGSSFSEPRGLFFPVCVKGRIWRENLRLGRYVRGIFNPFSLLLNMDIYIWVRTGNSAELPFSIQVDSTGLFSTFKTCDTVQG